jgi:hypothetical protein
METWITNVFDHLDWVIVFAMGLTLGLLTSLAGDRPTRDAPLTEQPKSVPKATPAETPAPELSSLFQGGSNSLVAIAVGTAEGTRTPDGGKTWAYEGHVDPGNGRWNLGSFSFQHCPEVLYRCATPEEADEFQLRRLQTQSDLLRQLAAELGMDLSLEEELNGIDLANQSPEAALSAGGYIDWLKEAKEIGLTGRDAILWARTRSFIDPTTGLWNAPGLGNNEAQITQDQERRMNAVGEAIVAQRPQVVTQSIG